MSNVIPFPARPARHQRDELDDFMDELERLFNNPTKEERRRIAARQVEYARRLRELDEEQERAP